MSSQNSTTPVHKSEPYYTNEDIAILHDIVLHAEEILALKPERDRIPTTALFEAYYSVLPKLGLVADHDSRYARVLFKIGGRRGHGSLYEKFENVLLQMGIDIQFDYLDDDEEQPEEPVPKLAIVEASSSSITGILHAPQHNEYQRKTKPQRRDSETSVRPVGLRLDADRKLRPRSSSFQSPSQLAPQLEVHNVPHNEAQVNSSRPQPGDHILTERRTKEIEAWMSPIVHRSDWTNTSDSTNGNGPRSAFQRGATWMQEQSSALAVSDEPEPTVSEIPEHEESCSQQYELSPHHINLYLESQAEYDAKIHGLQSAIRTSIAKRMLERWRQASSIQAKNLTKAASYCKEEQLKRIYAQWKQQKRPKLLNLVLSNAQPNRQYNLDRNFISMCFGQWTKQTLDAVQEATEARSHVRRRRIFMSWYHHVASKQIEARRHILSMHFSCWQSRYRGKMEKANDSTVFCENERLRRIIHMWFQDLVVRSMRKSEASSSKLLRLQLWTDKAAEFREISDMATANHSNRLKVLSLSAWVKRSRDIQALKLDSSMIHEQKLEKQSLIAWKRNHLLSLPAKQVYENSKQLLCRAMLTRWYSRTKQHIQASQMDAEKVKKEAWVRWADLYRYKRVQDRIDKRSKIEICHNWLVATKGRQLSKKVDADRLRKSLLQMWVVKHDSLERRASLDEAAVRMRSQKLTSSVMQKWRRQNAGVKQCSVQAAEACTGPIKRDCWDIWTHATRSTIQMQQWAGDAEFYYRAHRTIGKWRQMTAQSKKRRLHDAYSHSRRTNKLNLAANMLSTWRQKSRLAKQNNLLATEAAHDKTMSVAASAISRWQARRVELKSASVRYSSVQIHNIDSQWRVKLGKRGHQSALAAEFNERCLQARYLKKWKRETLRFRAHQHLVTELEDKHDKKSLRSIVSYWREAFLRRQETVDTFEEVVDVAPSPRPAAKTPAWPQSARQSRIAVVESIQSAPLSSLPPYLNTPSRRTLLARTMANTMSTTPSARLSTPLERQLRAQLTGKSLSAYAKRHTDRQPSKLRGFEDLQEDEEADDA